MHRADAPSRLRLLLLLVYTYIYVSIYACHVYCQALVLVGEEEKFCRKSALKNDFYFLEKYLKNRNVQNDVLKPHAKTYQK